MRSTNPVYVENPLKITINKSGKITNLAFTVIEVTGPQGKFYTDQSGRFSVTSSKGTKYVFVLY